MSDDVAGRFGPIFDPTRSVVLVASAGTGKTWRLVRRYLRIIATRDPATGEPWARPEEVVAVTFTRAAAAQMRARVFAALTASPSQVADDDPVLVEVAAELSAVEQLDPSAPAQEELGRAARLALAEHVAAAPIGTLHSLCARMLGEFPELSGVPPDARPLEPAEQALELDAFVSSWLDRVIDDPRHVAHVGCVELLGAHPLGFVRRELRAMVDDRLGADPSWLDPEVIARERERFVRAQWRDYVEQMRMPLGFVSRACAHELRGGRTPKLVEFGERIARLFHKHVPEPQLDSVAADVHELTSLRPSNELGSVAQLLVQLRNHHKVTSTRRERPVLPDPRACLVPGQADHLARWMALAAAARRDWVENLQQRAVLRYDDLELLARRLLDDPRARAHLRGRYRHVLVDEYQDVNAIQAEIIDRLVALCGPDEGGAKLFFVGDPKQSIYRFRGADPSVFESRREAAEVVMLGENRRSSPTLARFFMQLFPPLFAGVLPWANITDLGRPFELARLRDILDHAVVPWDGPIVPVREHDRLPGLAVDLLLRDRAQPIERSDDPDALAEEADRVAAHLRGLLDGVGLDAFPGQAPEQLRAREVAILVPRWSLAEAYRAALEARGIAADLAGGRGLLLLPEVRDLINLVRLWSDEHDELAALAVLRGPCFAISDLGLYALARWPGVDRRVREADPDLPEFAELDELWEAWDDEDGSVEWPRPFPRRIRELLRHGRLDPERAIAALEARGRILAQDEEAPEEARQRLLEQLQADAAALEAGRERSLACMRQAGARPTADLLADMIAGFRLEAHWLVGPRGRRAVANAWRFVEHVRTLEPEGPDLQRLSSWLDAGVEPAPEGLISPDADAVTITTWHGSKGKEWPIVVVAGLGEYREQGARNSWSGEPIPTLRGTGERIAVPRVNGPHEGFVAQADPLQEPCTNMLAPLEAAEAKRLLYVAMTRARDRLVLSGEVDARAHVSFDDKPYLGLDWGFDMKPLLGEPKPAYLCKRPIELLVAALDLPAARPGTAVIRPRAATWSLAHLRVVDDAMLHAGLSRWLATTPKRAPELVAIPEPKPRPRLELEPKPRPRRGRARKVAENQLSLFGGLAEPGPEPPVEPAAAPSLLDWRAGAALRRWNPSAGRSPWPITNLRWDMPLPARRPALLDEEDPRRLGELFHLAMERWDFEGEPPRTRELEPLVAVVFREREGADRRRITTWLLRCLELFGEDRELLAELRDARARDELVHEVDVEALIPEHERDHWIGGRVDLLWRDADGRWNVLDYKVTAKVRSRAQMQELEWEYGPQLLLYQRALARWRPQGQPAKLGRFGLWLATAGKAMWLVQEG